MNLADFNTLLTPAGQDAIHAASAFAPVEKDFLAHFQTLAKKYSPDLARAALETAIYRRDAVVKFPDWADQLYLTREALEQATPAAVSFYRMDRFRGFDRVLDLGCSVGGDTLALAETTPTLGVDLDPLRLAMARQNARTFSRRAVFIQADLLSPLPLAPLPNTAVFFDPARRLNRRRAYSVRHYTPPLDIIQTWLPDFPALGVKISPGVKLDEISGYDAEIEFISLNGELKEAVLWFGPFKSVVRRATLLPGEHIMTTEQLPKNDLPAVEQPMAYLYEPDPAVLRAGLVTALALQIAASQLDPEIAYLTSARFTETPFARCWHIEDWMPFNLKKLRAYLRERNVGRVTVKKRGSPIVPEELIHQLKLKGDEEKVIVLTKLNNRPIALICAAY